MKEVIYDKRPRCSPQHFVKCADMKQVCTAIDAKRHESMIYICIYVCVLNNTSNLV